MYKGYERGLNPPTTCPYCGDPMLHLTPDMQSQLIRKIVTNSVNISVGHANTWNIDMPRQSEFDKKLNLVFCQKHCHLTDLGNSKISVVQFGAIEERVQAMDAYPKSVLKNLTTYPYFDDVKRCLAAKDQWMDQLMELSSRGQYG